MSRWTYLLAAMGAGCGTSVHVKGGPSLLDDHPGVTGTVEAAIHAGSDRRAALLRFQLGGAFHDGLGGGFILGWSVGPAWDDGRWAAGAGLLGHLGGEDDGSLSIVAHLDRSLVRRVTSGRDDCPFVGPHSYRGYTVKVRELRLGVAGGAVPGTSFAWLPLGAGYVHWSLSCPRGGAAPPMMPVDAPAAGWTDRTPRRTLPP